MKNKFVYFFKIFFVFVNFLLFILANLNYPGNIIHLFLFAFSINFFLLYSFRKNSFFFETILAIFIWLGFWFKLLNVLLLSGLLREGIGNFDYSKELYDKGLIISYISVFSLILLSFFREKFIYNYEYSSSNKNSQNKIIFFYKKNRKKILLLFVALFSLFAFVNLNLNIYRKGLVSDYELNFLFKALFKWLTIFGFCSLSTFIIYYEFKIKKNVIFILFISVLESAVTNIGFLSRAMIFNQLALVLGIKKFTNFKGISFSIKNWVKYILLILVFFTISIYFVNKERKNTFIHEWDKKTSEKVLTNKFLFAEKTESNLKIEKKNILKDYYFENQKFLNSFKKNNPNIGEFFYLVLHRWVGLDAVFAVVSSNNLSFDTFKRSLNQKFDRNRYPFYERTFVHPQTEINNAETYDEYLIHGHPNNYGITLPGFIAFSYYSGSVLMLIILICIYYFICFFLELAAYKFSGRNIVFAALIGQVCAYRLIHFGYLPAQSYLLISAIVLNILIYFLFLKYLNK